MAAINTSTSFQLPPLSSSAMSTSLRGQLDSGHQDETVMEPLDPASLPPVNNSPSARAWLAVAGSFLFLFTSYGFMQTIGTIQSYLLTHQLAAYSSRDVGWIAGAFTALALFLGIQVGPLFDVYGPQYLAPIGCVIYIPVFFVLAECHAYWHFMLVLGIWGAVGAAIVSMVGVAVISRWFIRRRGMAMGLALCGSSIGGVIMPLMLRRLLSTVGWAWAIRSVAFLLAAVMVAGSLCLQQPLPPLPPLSQPLEDNEDDGEAAGDPHRRHGRHHDSRCRNKRKKATLNFKALRSWTFGFVTVGLSALEFAIFGVFSLLPTYAMTAHYDASTGFSLVAIANATSTAGRSLSGLASDHFGPFNTLIVMIIATTIFTASVLLPFGARSLGALYAFAGLWGFGSGSFISLTPVCMGAICETEDYGRYFGTMYFFASFALFITAPLGGQMLQTFGTTALAGLYVAVVAIGGVCFFFARQCLYRKHGLHVWAKI